MEWMEAVVVVVFVVVVRVGVVIDVVVAIAVAPVVVIAVGVVVAVVGGVVDVLARWCGGSPDGDLVGYFTAWWDRPLGCLLLPKVVIVVNASGVVDVGVEVGVSSCVIVGVVVGVEVEIIIPVARAGGVAMVDVVA